MVDGTGTRLRLGDLFAHDSFALEPLTGGPAAARRRVLGAHTVEVERPTRWLAPDWIMLTTGVRLRGHVAAQRALVEELQAAGVAALGFGVGLVFRRVPARVLEPAREAGFPVFAVPYETRFSDLVRFVDSRVLSGEVDLLRRVVALQRHLLDALGGPEPQRTMVERLARWVGAAAVLFDEDGQAQVVAGRPPVSELWAEIGPRAAGVQALHHDGWRAVAARVGSRAGHEPGWLVLAGRSAGFAHRMARPAVEACAPLLAAIAQLGDVVREQEQAVRGALLEEALERAEPAPGLPMAARAAAFGLDFSRPARVVVLRGADLEEVCHELVDRLEGGRVPHLVARRGPELLMALVQGEDDELAAVLSALAARRPGLVAGIGRAVEAIADARHSLRDAELAADRAGADPERRVLRFEDFDLSTFVVSEIDAERLAPKVEQLLSVLRPHPSLRAGLVAYFEHDLDVARAARALHLHPNSLRYRLGRVERLLGVSLRSPATIAALHIALVADAGAHEAGRFGPVG